MSPLRMHAILAIASLIRDNDIRYMATRDMRYLSLGTGYAVHLARHMVDIEVLS